MNIFVGLIVGVGILLVIAFPERFLPIADEKKKRVGASYWGFYQGAEVSATEDMPTIEAVAIKRKNNNIAGSTSYDVGRGVGGSSSG